MRKACPTDLSYAEWTYLEPYLPAHADTGRPRLRSLREILDAIFYIVRSGCAWRLLLKSWAEQWLKEGVKVEWEKLLPPKDFPVLPKRWVVERTFSWTDQTIRSFRDSCTLHAQ